MIHISYENGIKIRPETMDDTNIMIDLVRRFSTMNFVNGIWTIEDSEADSLSEALYEYRHVLAVDKSLKEWRESQKDKPNPVIIVCGPIKSKLYKNGNEIPHDDIEKATRFFLVAAVNMKKYKDGKWDGYINLYKRWLGEFPTGLLNDVIDVLRKKGLECQIRYSYDKSPQRQYNWEPKELFKIDDDQIEAVRLAKEAGRGILKAPTGFGKTAVLARYLTAEFGVPTLFVANKKSLLDDASEEFLKGIEGLTKVAQIKDGMFGDCRVTSGKVDRIKPIDAPVVVATIQSLNTRLEDEFTKAYLLDWLQNTCKLVIVDECQALGTTTWDNVMEQCYAPYRFALSATPRRTDGATIKLQAASGPIIFTTTASEQIDKGRLCELDINYVVYDHALYNNFDENVNYSDMYRMCITENEERNKKLALDPALDMLKEGRHVLILVQQIDHGHLLKEMFIRNGISPDDIRFVWGETPDKIRKEAIKEFKKGDFKIMIGSTIFDAGVNVPIISGVILMGAGNSDITLIQRIGRGARQCDYEELLGYIPEFMVDQERKVTRVVDVYDINTKFFEKQSKNRYYNACAEFGKDRVHIVGGDKRTILRKKTKGTVELDKQVQELAPALEMFKEFAR